MELKTGDICFTMNNSSFLSKLIAKVMGSNWSHTVIILEQTENRTYTLETNDFEVVIGYFDKYIFNKNYTYVVYRPKLSLVERIGMTHYAVQKTHGERYGYLQLISLGIRRLFKKFKINIPNFFRQGLVCDHVALYALSITSLKGFQNIDPESIDTEELYQLISNSSDFELVSYRF